MHWHNCVHQLNLNRKKVARRDPTAKIEPLENFLLNGYYKLLTCHKKHIKTL